ncbi:type II toxin-antitoxin system RelB/DinJ family antitoxin [Patescibacteria group bacterium]|nr:type II toxin-antitoxin system RelB/DinJ family antitoxin [Patescibacteria group bacterium]
MKTVINIKTDKEVKKNAKRVAEDLGFSLSAVINAYLKQFVRNKEVYFSVIPRMSSELEKLLGEIEIDIKKKRNISVAFSSEKELKNHLTSL